MAQTSSANIRILTSVITSCPAQVPRQSLAELAWPFPSTFQAQEGPIGEGGFRVTLVL